MDRKLIQELERAAGPSREIAAEEFARLVPLDSMTLEQTAQMIAELEAAGISVEIDQRLTSPNHKSNAIALPAETLVLSHKETWPRAPASALGRPIDTPEQAKPARTVAWPGVIAAFILLCAVAAALLWHFA